MSYHPELSLRKCVCWFTVFCLFALSAEKGSAAVVIAQYPFTGNSAASTDGDANSTAGTFTDGDGTLNFDGGIGNPVPSVFKSYSAVSNTSTAALNTANGSYWSFTVAPNAGFDLDLTTLQFDVQRDPTSPGNTVATFVLRSSFDSFASDLSTTSLNGNSGNFSVDLTTLGPPGFQDILLPLTFNIYVSDGGGGGTSTTTGVHIDNVTLNADVVVHGTGPGAPGDAPEAASLVVWSLLLGSAGLVTYRKRRHVSA